MLSTIRLVGTLGGTVVGLAALAFGAGFLAQRAQYDLVQIPFVDFDYNAWVEAGLLWSVTSLRVSLEHPFLLLAMASITALAILLVELEPVRRRLFQPLTLVALRVAALLLASLVLSQELVVQDMRKQAPDARLAIGPTLAPPPPPEPAELPATAEEVWAALADEVEARMSEEGHWLLTRPRANWMLASQSRDDRQRAQAVLGRPVPQAELPEARGRAWYGWLLVGWLAAAWLTAAASILEQRTHELLASRSLPDPGARFVRLRPFQEEIWFTSRWLLRPVGMLILVAAAFLSAETYGVLAMPRIGQEFVEILLAKEPPRSGDGKGGSGGGDDTSLAAEAQRLIQKEGLLENLHTAAARLLEQHSGLEDDQQGENEQQFRRVIDRIEMLRVEDATSALSDLARMGAVLAPELARYAFETWKRSGSARREGHILYYPRSDTDYLRLVERRSLDRGWTITPIRRASVLEIRVKEDDRAALVLRLRALAAGLPDADDRLRILKHILNSGNPLALEVFLGATRDRSYRVHGPAVTLVGRLARDQPKDPEGRRRKQVTERFLLAIVADSRYRNDVRGSAATALHLMRPQASPQMCSLLEGRLREAGGKDDPHWEIGGTIITTLGKIRCRTSVPVLVELLKAPTTPTTVRRSIPTALMLMGHAEGVASGLIATLDAGTALPEDMIGATLAALGRVGEGDEATGRALVAFLCPADPKASPSVELRRVAIVALASARYRAAVDCLARHVDRGHEPDSKTREFAAEALATFESASAFPALARLATDEDEGDTTRKAAIAGIGRLIVRADEGVDVLLAVTRKNSSGALRIAAKEALKDLADGGSGKARAGLSEVEGEPQVEDGEDPAKQLQDLLEDLRQRSSPTQAPPEGATEAPVPSGSGG